MKKIITCLLSFAMVIMMSACSGSAPAGSSAAGSSAAASSAAGKEIKCGVLTLLNTTEDEMRNVAEATILGMEQMVKDGYIKPRSGDVTLPSDSKLKIVYYDTLDAMQMALEAGEIQMMRLYYTTAKYLCANNDKLALNGNFDVVRGKFTDVDIADIAPKDMFAFTMSVGLISNDFAFMTLEKNTALRDEFNKAVLEMKKDGTYSKLVKEQINDMLDGGEIKPVEMPVLNSVRNLKVAVTGSLPPMDYVAADGKPAGFNTAMLAEISKRIGANIELVVVDSVGRAAALSSGAVDAVFWTRTDNSSSMFGGRDDSFKDKVRERLLAQMTKDQQETMKKIDEKIDFAKMSTQDMPQGTIITDPYYRDILVNVVKK